MSAARRPPAREPSPWSDEFIRDLSEAVYRKRLGPADVARMIEKDGDGGAKLRARAGAYDTLTRAFLEVARERQQGRGNKT